jgi:hypothetical protein
LARYGSDFFDSGARYGDPGNQKTKTKGRTMATNPTPNDDNDLLALAEDMADGLHTLEVPVGVKQNTEAVMRAAITACRSANTALGVAKAARGAAVAAERAADETAREFIREAKKVLQHYLGDAWNAGWEATGFPHQSTAIPNSEEERLNLCSSLKDYFAANPAHESAQFGVTAALADAAFTGLSNARDDQDTKRSAVTAANAAVNTAFYNLRKRVRGLIGELETLLTNEDARWHEFGLSRPVDPDTPERVEGLVLTPNLAGKVLASWNGAPRASRYRVFKQVVGVDLEPVNVETVHDRQYLIEGLPGGQTVKVHVVAGNDAGEAPASEVVEAVVP